MTIKRPRRPQLRTRVLAGVILVTVLVLAAFDAAAVTALHRYLIGQTDSRLQTVLNLYRPAGASITLQPKAAAVPSGEVTPAAYRPATGQVRADWQVAIAGPHQWVKASVLDAYWVAFVSRHGPPKGFFGGNRDLVPVLPPGRLAFTIGPHIQTVASRHGSVPLRLRAAPVPGAGALVATTSLGNVNSTVGRLERILIIGSAAACLLVGLGTAWVMRRGLRPIETMAAQADRITAGDLTDRVRHHDPATEVGRLGTALNGMLTRIEASVHEREASQELTRRFFADASHELRNPLASLRANAELYQQGVLRQRRQVDEAMRRIAAEAQRMSALVDDMLRLARLDQHPRPDHEPVDLTALARECAERAQTTSPERAWHTRIGAGLVVTGDEEMLRRAIDNLLANVAAHTPGDTVATIAATTCGSAVTVEVSDDGPGVPADRLPRIFDRFYRAGAPAQCPGSGLGLAIVAAIVTAHHGTAIAAPNRPRGLSITFTLPTAGAAAAAGAAPATITAPVTRAVPPAITVPAARTVPAAGPPHDTVSACQT